MYQRIFVPVDDSKISRRALDEEPSSWPNAPGQRCCCPMWLILAQFGLGWREFLDAPSCRKNIGATGEAVLNRRAKLRPLEFCHASAVLLEN